MQHDEEDRQAFLPHNIQHRLSHHRRRPSGSFPPWSSQLLSVLRTRKLVLICCLAIFSLLGFLFVRLKYSTRPDELPSNESAVVLPSATPQSPPVSKDPFGPASNLLGAPAVRFRDNLRPDRKYITGWISAGWTNDVMTYMNLVYLGLITERIPIIPMFTASHVGNVPPVEFGVVFDLPRLRTALGKPILEWGEVKTNDSEIVEEIGCWNTWEAVQIKEKHPRNSPVTTYLKLDISYTKAPSWIKLIPFFEHDLYTSFWSLATLAYPEGRNAALGTTIPSPQNETLLPPDEHIVCYDYLYYVCANQPFEFEFDFSPAWNMVGRHFRWTERIEELAHQYVKKTIGVPQNEPAPPWIAIHMRHGDFKVYCPDGTEDCLPSISVIARRVEEVKAELRERKGIDVKYVIMTSDEKNSTWWDDVKSQGWYQVDHSETGQTFGPWYAVFIDAAIQSLGIGFVGTDRSTMSVIARRRVQTWSDGATRIVKWGKPGADDH